MALIQLITNGMLKRFLVGLVWSMVIGLVLATLVWGIATITGTPNPIFERSFILVAQVILGFVTLKELGRAIFITWLVARYTKKFETNQNEFIESIGYGLLSQPSWAHFTAEEYRDWKEMTLARKNFMRDVMMSMFKQMFSTTEHTNEE